MGRWGDGEMGCIRYLPLIQSSNQLLPIFYQFLILPTYFLEIPNAFYKTSYSDILMFTSCLLVSIPSLGQHSLSWCAFPLLVSIPLRLSATRGLTACDLRHRGVATLAPSGDAGSDRLRLASCRGAILRNAPQTLFPEGMLRKHVAQRNVVAGSQRLRLTPTLDMTAFY